MATKSMGGGKKCESRSRSGNAHFGASYHCPRTFLPDVVENSTKFLPLVTVAVAGGSWSFAGSTVETVQGGFTSATGKGRKRTGCQSPQSTTVFVGPKDTR